MVVRTEGAQPTAWVYVDVAGRDIGGYVTRGAAAVQKAVVLPAGYTLTGAGSMSTCSAPRSG